MRGTLSGKTVSNWYTIGSDINDCWTHDVVTNDLYGKGVIVINEQEFPFIEITVE